MAVAVKSPVKLNRERVGDTLARLSDARVGETVNFIYKKDRWGDAEERNVLVVKVNSEGIEGLDEHRGAEYRKFLNDKAEAIDIVEPFAEDSDEPEVSENEVFVRFDEALERLGQSLDGDKLAELYLQHVATEGESARYDAVRGGVVITLPTPQNEVGSVHLSNSSSRIELKNKRKETFTQYIYDDATMGVVDSAARIDEHPVKPERLAELLNAFLTR